MSQGVIFDFNGVIVNDEHLHLAALRAVAAEFGVTIDQQYYRQHLTGRLASEVFTTLLRDANVSVNVEECVRRKERFYEVLFRQGVSMFPGVSEVITELWQAGYRLGIASTARRELIDCVIENASMRSYFTAIVSGEDVKKGKPDPEAYLIAAARLELAPRACVAVEDSIQGIAAAHAAGMACIAVASTLPPDDLRSADLVVRSLAAIDSKVIRSAVHHDKVEGGL